MAAIICDSERERDKAVGILPLGIGLVVLHVRELWYLYFQES
jgi:hypothetical protein